MLVRQAFELGVEVPQETANAIGNFNVQGFRLTAVLWLVNNNYLLASLQRLLFAQ
jgi:hypothetical protein